MGLLYSSTTFTVWTKRVYDWFDFKRTCILFHQSVFFYANHLGSNIMLAGDMNVIVGCVVPREEVDIRITQSWNIKDVTKVNCLFFCVLCRRTSRFMPNGFANVIEIGEQAINAHLFQHQCAYIFVIRILLARTKIRDTAEILGIIIWNICQRLWGKSVSWHWKHSKLVYEFVLTCHSSQRQQNNSLCCDTFQNKLIRQRF